ncbi:MAG: TonB-dependent receptor, partial [Acidobacteriota bacterium]
TKIDQNMGGKGKISGFWSLTRTISDTSTVLGADGLPDPISQARANYDWVHTIRINYDYNLSPSMLLHVGTGYVNQRGPTGYLATRNEFDPASIGLKGLPYTGIFPRINGLAGANNTGGMANMGQATAGGSPENHRGGGFHSWRPSGNASLTWIKNSHSYKFGGETMIAAYTYSNQSSTRGIFNYSANSTADSSTFPTNPVAGVTSGFPYASFLLGATDSYTIGPPTDQHMGEKSFALFAQDTWKATRRLTVDYGLRYDFQTYLRETQGRWPSFSPNTINSTYGRNGAVIFDGLLPGRCQCYLGKNYPAAVGPRLGVAYQINSKTVLRGGFGIVYNKTSALNNQTVLGNDSAFASPGQFAPALYLKDGVTASAGTWPDLRSNLFPTTQGSTPAGLGVIDPGAGRPARQMQWSVGLQREISKNLVVEASWVGNRGAWWQAPALTTYNAISNQAITAAGLDINSANDQALLRGTVRATGAIARGFGLPYGAFPTTLTLAQSLRPFPQFGDIPSLYAPLGDTWYNALQTTVTKRFSHGLDFTYNFTWQRSLTSGTENASGVITGGAAEQVNDVFNRKLNKYLSGYDQPLVSQLAVNYILPKFGWNSGMGVRTLSWVARDWTVGAFLAYRSGQPLRVPGANSNLNSFLFRGASYANRAAGQPLFLNDLNDNSLDPARTLYLNPAAWADPPTGQFSSSAAYYTDYRLQRRPTENMSVGRTFRVKERVTFNVRGEFSNIFNRTQMSNPSSASIATTVAKNTSTGVYTSGFGFINTGATASLPRQGSIVARLQF